MIFSEVVGVIILYITYFLLEFCAIIYIDFFKKKYTRGHLLEVLESSSILF